MEELKTLFRSDSVNLGKNILKTYLEINGGTKLKNIPEYIYDGSFETKKRFVPSSAFEVLENYYSAILGDETDENLFSLFERILESYKEEVEVVFLAFWFPYIKSKESFAVKILETTKVFCGNVQIGDVTVNIYPSSMLNTHAFKLAISNNFNDSLLSMILDQGKVKVPIEWVMDNCIARKLELVERALQGGNDCSIYSRDLINLVSEKLESNENFKGIINSKVASQKKSNIFNRKASTTKVSSTSMNKFNISEPTAKGKEVTSFLVKKSGKLTITKMIVFTSLIYDYYRDRPYLQIHNFEEGSVSNLIKAICLFDRRDKKFTDQILEGLYLIKKKEIARELLEANMLSINLIAFKTSIEYKDLKFALEFYTLYKDFSIYENDSVHILIIENLIADFQFIEVYLYFLKQFVSSKFVSFSSTKFFLKIAEDLLQHSCGERAVIHNLSNPIKIYVLIAEVLNILKVNFPLLEYNITRLIEKCLKFSEELQNLIEEDHVFREVVLEKDISGKMLLDIICDNQFFTLLKNKLVEKVVDDQWKGNFSTDGAFLETSYNYRSLLVAANPQDYDVFTNLRNSLDEYDPKKYKTSFAPFKVWRKNVYIKYYLELFVTLAMLFFFQTVSILIMSNYRSTFSIDPNNISQMDLQIKSFIYSTSFLNNRNFSSNYNFTDYDKFTTQNLYSDAYKNLVQTCNIYDLDNATFYLLNETLSIYTGSLLQNTAFVNDWIQIVFKFLYLFITLPVSYIIRYIFKIKSKEVEYGLTILSDKLLFLYSLVILAIWDNSHIRRVSTRLELLRSQNVACFEFLPNFQNDMNLILNDSYWLEMIILSILSILLWSRFILTIRATKTFGPIIVIFFLAVDGVLNYIMLFFVMTLSYACFAFLFFYNVGDYYYKNIFNTLFYFTLVSLGGEPSYDSYNDSAIVGQSPYIPWLGGLTILLILIINSIVLFNIVVAHLSNIYEKYSTFSKQLFIQKKIQISRKYCSEDSRYDSLLTNVFPLDVITFPFSLVFLFSKNDKLIEKTNNIILFINYFLFALIYTMIYAVSSLALIPFSYFKICLTKLLQIPTSDIQQYFLLYKVMAFITYVAFGLLIHFYAYFIDLIIFVKELNKDKIILLTDNENAGKFTIKESLLKLLLSSNVLLEKGVDYRIHIERVFEILLKAYEYEDPDFSELKDLFDLYNLESDDPVKINEEFNIYINNVEERLEKKGIDYQELCDFLSNFWDDRYIVDFTNLKAVLTTFWKNKKMNDFFQRVSDKNFNTRVNKKQKSLLSIALQFTSKQETRTGYQKLPTTPQLTPRGEQGNENAIVEVSHQNEDSSPNSISKNSLSKNASSILGRTNPIMNILTGGLPAGRRKSLAVFQGLLKRKTTQFFSIKNSKETYVIPIISRNTVNIFVSEVKEVGDQTKKLEEGIMKNQKYLKELARHYNLSMDEPTQGIKNKNPQKENKKPQVASFLNLALRGVREENEKKKKEEDSRNENDSNQKEDNKDKRRRSSLLKKYLERKRLEKEGQKFQIEDSNNSNIELNNFNKMNEFEIDSPNLLSPDTPENNIPVTPIFKKKTFKLRPMPIPVGLKSRSGSASSNSDSSDSSQTKKKDPEFREFDTNSSHHNLTDMDKRITVLEGSVGDVLRITKMIYSKLNMMHFDGEVDLSDRAEPSSWRMNKNK